jgi:hypothetical protein
MTHLGVLELREADLEALVDVLAPRIAERLRLADTGDWYTPAEYAARGWSSSREAAYKRARRLEAKGSGDVRRIERSLFLRGPSNGSPGTVPRGATNR